MDFFKRKHLRGLRSRAYFEQLDSDVTGLDFEIHAEGAYRITIVNTGSMTMELTDGAGNTLLLIGGRSFPLILECAPYLVRDDIIKGEFDDTSGFAGAGHIIYDRLVKTKDDNVYPGEVYADN